jgi:hypothetical protein
MAKALSHPVKVNNENKVAEAHMADELVLGTVYIYIYFFFSFPHSSCQQVAGHYMKSMQPPQGN